MKEYTTKPAIVYAVQWNEDPEDLRGIVGLVGTTNVHVSGDRIQVRTMETWVELCHGFWVLKAKDDGVISVASEAPFRKYWQEKT